MDFRRSGSLTPGGRQRSHTVDAATEALRSYYCPQSFSLFVVDTSESKPGLVHIAFDFTKLVIASLVALTKHLARAT